MATANQFDGIIESKAVLMSLLRDDEHSVLETALEDERGTGVTLLRLSTSDFAVCDKSQEGTYVTYLCGDEDKARDCFQACATQWEN